MTNEALAKLLFPPEDTVQESDWKMPDFDYVHNKLIRNDVSKKLLWIEYLEDCRQTVEKPLMYLQFCYYTQKDVFTPNQKGRQTGNHGGTGPPKAGYANRHSAISYPNTNAM